MAAPRSTLSGNVASIVKAIVNVDGAESFVDDVDADRSVVVESGRPGPPKKTVPLPAAIR